MDDLISRQAAIDVVKGIDTHFVKYIQQIPSAQPEPCEDAVSRTAVKQLLAKIHDAVEDGDGFDYESAVDDLMGLPSAQPQIIRCKDCKHWIPYDWMFSEIWQSKNMADYPEDEIGCNYCDMAMKANDFCSRGERRTE